MYLRGGFAAGAAGFKAGKAGGCDSRFRLRKPLSIGCLPPFGSPLDMGAPKVKGVKAPSPSPISMYAVNRFMILSPNLQTLICSGTKMMLSIGLIAHFDRILHLG